jgi:hypothetical protein
MQVAIDTMGERGKWLPPFPRLELGNYTLLPLVDDEWEPVFPYQWVLPGRAVLTTEQVRDLAAARGLAVSILTQ